MASSKIIGVGGYLPEKVLSNLDLEKSIDTSDEWIKSRTGITQRHIANDNQYTSDLAYKAALDAISRSELKHPDEIDLIINCTNTADNTFPSVANKVQGLLKLKNTPSFDLQAICSGFLYGLQTADSFIKSGKYKTILLICADKMSSILNWQDRRTCVLFGDGAGAVILRESDSDSRIIDCDIFSDGSYYDMLYTSGGVSSNGKSGTVQMAGSEVFKQAVEKMPESIHNILKKNNITLEEINYIIPHQANIRIISNMINRMGISKDKVITTLDKHANCSAASIPLALKELKLTCGIKSGDILVFTAFGAGATWGASVMRW